MLLRRRLVRKRQSLYHVHSSSLTDIQEDTLDTSISTNNMGEGEGLAIRSAPQVIVVSETLPVEMGFFFEGSVFRELNLKHFFTNSFFHE